MPNKRERLEEKVLKIEELMMYNNYLISIYKEIREERNGLVMRSSDFCCKLVKEFCLGNVLSWMDRNSHNNSILVNNNTGSGGDEMEERMMMINMQRNNAVPLFKLSLIGNEEGGGSSASGEEEQAEMNKVGKSNSKVFFDFIPNVKKKEISNSSSHQKSKTGDKIKMVKKKVVLGKELRREMLQTPSLHEKLKMICNISLLKSSFLQFILYHHHFYSQVEISDNQVLIHLSHNIFYSNDSKKLAALDKNHFKISFQFWIDLLNIKKDLFLSSDIDEIKKIIHYYFHQTHPFHFPTFLRSHILSNFEKKDTKIWNSIYHLTLKQLQSELKEILITFELSVENRKYLSSPFSSLSFDFSGVPLLFSSLSPFLLSPNITDFNWKSIFSDKYSLQEEEKLSFKSLIESLEQGISPSSSSSSSSSTLNNNSNSTSFPSPSSSSSSSTSSNAPPSASPLVASFALLYFLSNLPFPLAHPLSSHFVSFYPLHSPLYSSLSKPIEHFLSSSLAFPSPSSDKMSAEELHLLEVEKEKLLDQDEILFYISSLTFRQKLIFRWLLSLMETVSSIYQIYSRFNKEKIFSSWCHQLSSILLFSSSSLNPLHYDPKNPNTLSPIHSIFHQNPNSQDPRNSPSPTFSLSLSTSPSTYGTLRLTKDKKRSLAIKNLKPSSPVLGRSSETIKSTSSPTKIVMDLSSSQENSLPRKKGRSFMKNKKSTKSKERSNSTLQDSSLVVNPLLNILKSSSNNTPGLSSSPSNTLTSSSQSEIVAFNNFSSSDSSLPVFNSSAYFNSSSQVMQIFSNILFHLSSSSFVEFNLEHWKKRNIVWSHYTTKQYSPPTILTNSNLPTISPSIHFANIKGETKKSTHSDPNIYLSSSFPKNDSSSILDRIGQTESNSPSFSLDITSLHVNVTNSNNNGSNSGGPNTPSSNPRRKDEKGGGGAGGGGEESREKVKEDQNVYLVAGSSFEEAINLILSEGYNVVDSSFVKLFLYTHLYYSTSHQLLSLLFEKYKMKFLSLSQPNHSEEEKRVFRARISKRKDRIIYILTEWFCNFDILDCTDLDSNFLKLFSQFVDYLSKEEKKEKRKENKSKILKNCLQNLEKFQKQKMETLKISLQHNQLSELEENITFTEIDSFTFAQQLILFDHKLFSMISTRELFFKNWDKEETSPFFTRMTKHWNTVGNCVTTLVVMQKDLSKRVQIIEKFLNIANYCLTFHDFHSCYAIVGGLGNISVDRLSKTWAIISKSSIEIKNLLSSMFSISNNYQNLRKKMESVNRLVPVVPYNGLIKKDLFAIEESNKNYFSEKEISRFPAQFDPNQKIINFEKMRLLSKVVQNVMSFQKRTPYKFPNNNPIAFYIKNLPQIDNSDKLYELSLIIEPKVVHNNNN